MTAGWVPSSWDAVKAGDTVRLENADGAVEFVVVKTQQTRDCWHLHSEIGDYSEWGWNLSVPAPTTPPLPTEPGHYLDFQNDLWTLNSHGARFCYISPGDNEGAAKYGPFVKLEPVAVTAKAVLLRIREVYGEDYIGNENFIWNRVANEFGVTL